MGFSLPPAAIAGDYRPPISDKEPQHASFPAVVSSYDTLGIQMASVLPDREIKKFVGTAITGGSADCIRVNSYEVRLGHKARFDSTGELVEIPGGHFLEIEPGDFVTVESLEALDLRPETTRTLGKENGVFAWITPTTTMMREGFLFASTKVDAGYKGNLNWGIRNSSIKTIRLQQGEHLFKLTFLELSPGEKPDRFYGDDEADHYQGTTGIKESARMIPADIPDRLIVRRSQRKIDPIKQLTQAGYPFNHIGTELIELQGKFEVVSKDVALVKDGFENLQKALGEKIEKETGTLSRSISDLGEKMDSKIGKTFSEQFGLYFDSRMLRVYGVVGGIFTTALGLYKLVIQTTPVNTQGYVLCGLGILLLIGTMLLTRSPRKH
jgi:deoxycytidine triphosphate deaminase